MSCLGVSALAWAAVVLGVAALDTQVTLDSAGNVAQTKEEVVDSSVVRRATVQLHPDSSNEHKTHVMRSDLTYVYKELEAEMQPSACESHFEYKGLLSNDQCAAECHKQFGCTKFSAGGCTLGCRISVPGKLTNNHDNKDANPDGQCYFSDPMVSSNAGGCIAFKLIFFRYEAAGYCKDEANNFERVSHATNKAECAHACKNLAGCKSFSSPDGLCMKGCRISKPDAAGTGRKCTTTPEPACETYEMISATSRTGAPAPLAALASPVAPASTAAAAAPIAPTAPAAQK